MNNIKKMTYALWKNTSIHLLIPLVTIFILCVPGFAISDSPSLETLRQLDVKKMASFEEMKAAVNLIAKCQTTALDENTFSVDFQKLVCSKSGECISGISSIYRNLGSLTLETNEAAKELHLNIRHTLLKILARNETIISDLQENTLDQLEDKAVFFRSPRWQEPQYLISLSSYWLGWNGYYGSLVISENDPMNHRLLNEAIKGFSRAFIDFSEDAAISRSLFGRGLCYSRLKAYEKARNDFKIARMKMSRDDPLYFRCLYEDIRIIYRTGNFETAKRRIDEIEEDFPKEKVPKDIATAFLKLKSKILIALSEKQGKKDKKEIIQQGIQNISSFEQAKQLAENPNNQDVFYQYVRQNWKNLKNLTFEDLGPVGLMAIGDLFFDKKKYGKALEYYESLHADYPSYCFNRPDSLWFRTAYCYWKNKQWDKSFPYLDKFHKKFPSSSLAKQAAVLYYTAATRNYENKATKTSQKHYIDSIQLYIKQDSGNSAELSEAHYKLGKYYYQSGNIKKAISEFLTVKEDSPNYHAAQHYVLKNYINELEYLEKKGQLQSKSAATLYEKGLRLLKTYRDAIKNKKTTVPPKGNNAYLTILESQLLLFGTGETDQSVLNILKSYEKRFPFPEKLHLDAFQLRLSCYHRLGLTEEIKTEIDRFASFKSLKSERLFLLHRLGNDYFQGGQNPKIEESEAHNSRNWDTALLIYDKLSDLSHQHPEYESYSEAARLRMAQIYIQKDQVDKAERLYREILEKNSLSADAVYNLGLLYEKKEQWEEALGIWRRFSKGIEEGTFHWFESRYRIARALAKLGNHKKACDILTITLVLHPDFETDELKQKISDLKSNVCP